MLKELYKRLVITRLSFGGISGCRADLQVDPITLDFPILDNSTIAIAFEHVAQLARLIYRFWLVEVFQILLAWRFAKRIASGIA